MIRWETEKAIRSTELTQFSVGSPDVLYASRGAHLQVSIVVLVVIYLHHGDGFPEQRALTE